MTLALQAASPLDAGGSVAGHVRQATGIAVTGAFDLPTLDVSQPTASVAANFPIFDLIYGTLFTVGAGGVIQPALALGYKLSRDHRSVTLFLRPHLTFQDGTPLDARAVAWNINRDRLATAGPSCRVPLADLEGVATLSPVKVVLVFRHPYAPIISSLATGCPGMMASPTAVSSEGEQQFGDAPVGAGPYRLLQYGQPYSVTVVRWAAYWDARRTHASTISFRNSTDPSTSIGGIESGGTQLYVDPGLGSLAFARLDPHYLKVVALAATSFVAFLPDVRTAPFDNEQARKAVAYALDARSINSQVFDGLERPSASIFGTGDSNYLGTSIPGAPAYDAPQAVEAVQGLGGLSFSYGLSGVRFSPLGTRAVASEVAAALSAQFSAVGIHATVGGIASGPGASGQSPASYAGLVLQYGGFSDDGIYAAQFFQSDGAFAHFRDPHLDALVAQANRSFSATTRTALFRRAMSYVDANAYVIPMYTLPRYYIAARYLAGIPRGTPVLYLANAYLK
ncbi:MAG TPA: ABC transporter substrate-binding protein [Acidimicrobiales bacterium]|nr:ABC transporter substrate-binding protein [Acidimicrobiales bacterium]